MEELLKALLTSPEYIAGIAEQYKPVLYAVFGELFKMFKDLVNNDDYFETNAKYSWKIMQSYMSAGFTREEAFAVLMNSREKLLESFKKSGASVKLNNNTMD